MANKTSEGLDQLKDVSSELVRNLGERVLGNVNDRVTGLTEKLTDIGDGNPLGKAVKTGAEASSKGENPLLGGLKGAASGIKDKITGGGNKGEDGEATSSTNIIETIDVGVPLSVAYNQWTEFGAFPSFMKKVEDVEAEEDNKLTFRAQIFLSHREWEATVLEQVPDERIVWRSKGEKGHVDGAVTFHELAPNLTRILVVLEYYPQGLFEKTANLWRAQGRRARAELRHFRRHVMTRTVLNPDDVEGWRGVIEDGEVVESHEDHVEQEQEQDEAEQPDAEEEDADAEGYDDSEDEYDEDPEDPEDEYDEADRVDEDVEDDDEEADEEADDDVDDEYADEDVVADDVDEDEDVEDEDVEDEYVEEDEEEEPEEEEEPAPRRRRAS
jgi:uncharacterized membrane protein